MEDAITFFFHNSEIVFSYCWRDARIIKNQEDNYLYFDGSVKLDKKFIDKYYDIIMQTFQMMEYFDNLMQGNSDKKITEKYSDGFLDIIIEYSVYAGACINIEINNSVDPEKIYKREWYGRESLNDYLKQNKEVILKKIPITIDDMDSISKKIVEEIRNNIDQPKILSIGKK